ncbi:MAG: T9SS type A sorting domain-containing protein [Bacteroidetes bacterium]|nr:T9SS type A sorting domain-containing protein [Bacteroidota bacterium]
MKKTLLSLFTGMFCTLAISQASVGNNSFENWYTLNVKDSLDYWYISTQQYQSSGILDVNNTYAISNAHSGSYAVHMETVLWYDQGAGQNDTLFGYAVKEAANQYGFIGFPYTDTVDIFTCWYKCGIVAGDMGVIIVELSKNGTTYSTTNYPVVGSQSSWTQLNIPLSGGAGEEPDSVFVGFASSDPFNPGVAKPGSWLEIDDVSFGFLAGSVTPAAIPNNSFENWTYETIEQPSAWFSFDQLLYPMTQSLYVTKSTTASAGTYSAQIETTFETIMSGIPAILTNGFFSPALDSVIGGTPFIAQPAQISGMYQFAPSFADTGYVYVDFWNSTSGIHSMYADTLLDAAVWTPWSIDLTFTEAPDSVIIYFFSGDNLGSTLLVDDIQFTGGDVSVTESAIASTWTIFPNPASGIATIQFEAADQIRIFDLSGKLVYSVSPATGTTEEINTALFENGTYLVQVIKSGYASVQKLNVQH